MPKSSQAGLKRKLAQAHRNAGKVIDDLVGLAVLFAVDHDEMAQLLRVVCVSMEMSQEMMAQFSLKAWGRIPEDWESWRNPNKHKPVKSDAPPV